MRKILLVDDHKLFRDGLKYALAENFSGQMDEAENGEEALQKIKQCKYDLIITDISMPVMNGLDLVRNIRSFDLDQKILVLSMHTDEFYVSAMLKLGVNGYLSKSCGSNELERAIYEIIAGSTYFSRIVSNVIMEKLSGNDNTDNQLTDKEIAIIRLICQEKTNKEISEDLGVSPRTIEGARAKIISKLNIKNTSGIVLYAIKNNLI